MAERDPGRPVQEKPANPHDSAHLHVSGAARYADDEPEPANMLHLAFGQSAQAHAKIVGLDLAAVRAAPGVVAVFTADDIPGVNDVSPVAGDDKLLATDEVLSVGQPVFLVAATSQITARKAARLGTIAYEPLPVLVSYEDAQAAQSLIEPTQLMAQGNADTALAAAPLTLNGTFDMGGQDHFYLEGQVAVAKPGEDGQMHVLSSTQHPSEVQHLIAHMLHKSSADMTVEVRRMGGAFGGKETQAALFAAAAALVAHKTGRPAKFRCDRDDDMVMTGKRHDFRVSYDVGFDADGRLLALKLFLSSRCGASVDLSPAINDRAMFHADIAIISPTSRSAPSASRPTWSRRRRSGASAGRRA